MRHLIQHILENLDHVTKVSTACDMVLLVGARDVEPGAQVDVEDGVRQWCPRCLSIAKGEEVEQGLHPDLGVAEDDGQLGPPEESELGDIETENDWGAAEEVLPDDAPPSLGR